MTWHASVLISSNTTPCVIPVEETEVPGSAQYVPQHSTEKGISLLIVLQPGDSKGDTITNTLLADILLSRSKTVLDVWKMLSALHYYSPKPRDISRMHKQSEPVHFLWSGCETSLQVIAH